MGGHDGMGEGVLDEFDIIVAKDDFVFGLQAHFAPFFIAASIISLMEPKPLPQ